MFYLPPPEVDLIASGDALVVRVEELPEISGRYPVGPDGAIHLRGVGALPAAATVPADVSRRLWDVLRSNGFVISRSPSIRLVKGNPRGVRVEGRVQPSVLRFAPDLTLSALLAQVPPEPDADLDRVWWIRPEGVAIAVSRTASLLLRDGDRIFIPGIEGPSQVTVTGGVMQPGAFAIREVPTVADALKKAGGLINETTTEKIVLRRGVDNIPILLPEDATMRLRPGDNLWIVPRINQGVVLMKSGVRRPGYVTLREGLTLRQAIEAAGGTQVELESAWVIYSTGSGKNLKTVRLKLQFILNGRLPDVVLQPNDSVEVVRGSK